MPPKVLGIKFILLGQCIKCKQRHAIDMWYANKTNSPISYWCIHLIGNFYRTKLAFDLINLVGNYLSISVNDN